MTKPILIRNGHIIDPSRKLDKVGSLLIADGRISWLGSKDDTPPSSDYDSLYASGLIVCPGFIDLHCHLRQPGLRKRKPLPAAAVQRQKEALPPFAVCPIQTHPSTARL